MTTDQEEALAIEHTRDCKILANTYHYRHPNTILEHLTSEALLAMVLAIRSHDPAKGVLLGTHIEYRAWKAMQEYNRSYSKFRCKQQVGALTEQLDGHDVSVEASISNASQLSLELLLEAVEGLSFRHRRKVEMYRLAQMGFAYPEIGRKFGVHTSRVSQIVGTELPADIRRVMGRRALCRG